MDGTDWQEQARKYEEMVEKSQNIFNPQTIQARLALMHVLRVKLLSEDQEEKVFIESVIWKTCVYNFFDQFRKLLKKCARKEEAQLELLEHLEMSIGFYLTIVAQSSSKHFFHNILPINNNNNSKNKRAKKDDKKDYGGRQFEATLLSTLYCRLGDLYRYCHSYCELEDVRDVYWENAKKSYEAAASENPRNGLPFNNLGVLFAGRNKVMLALEFYCRALGCENTATSALMNAKGLLTHYKDLFNSTFLYKLSSSNTSSDHLSSDFFTSTHSPFTDFDDEREGEEVVREKFILNTLSKLL